MDPQPVQIPVTVVYLNQKYEQSEPDGPLVPVDGNDLPKVITCVKSPGHNWTHYYLYGTYIAHTIRDLDFKRQARIVIDELDGRRNTWEVEAIPNSTITVYTHFQDYYLGLAQIPYIPDEGFSEN